MDGSFYVDTRAPHISTDVAAVTLATTDKALVPIANIPPLGTNYFGYVGKAIRITLAGRITTAVTPGNAQMDVYWGNGGDAAGTLIASSNASALTANQTAIFWWAQVTVRCRALGVTGSLFCMGFGMFSAAVLAAQQLVIPASTPVAVTADLTLPNVISVQFKRSGSTVETMQVHEYIFESLN